MTDETDSQQGQPKTPESSGDSLTDQRTDSPAMAMLMESMEAAIGGLAHTQQEAASQVPKIRAEHERLQQELADAYDAEDFKRCDELDDEITALEHVWTTTLHTVGPDPEAFGLPEHPTLVDPDN